MKAPQVRWNQDGTARVYNRLVATGELIRVPGVTRPDDPKIAAHYTEINDTGQMPAAVHRARQRRAGGSLAQGIAAYMRSTAWQALAVTTREQRGRILGKIDEAYGDVPAVQIRDRHIQADIGELAPHVARNRLKVWRGLTAFLHSSNRCPVNAAKTVDSPRAPRSEGFRFWTIEQINQYRAYHRYGTPARMALELSFWTGSAAADAVRLGRQMVDQQGMMSFRRCKTGEEAMMPFWSLPSWMMEYADLVEDHRHLLSAIDAMPKTMLFLQTRDGRPRSSKSLGSDMSGWAQAAGLPTGLSTHGLRKARQIELAEMGWSDKQRMAWAGHATEQESVAYARQADRRSVLLGSDPAASRRVETATSTNPRCRNGEKP
ncbi:MAG: tyrosine-type recombinase/integrase [Pseudomonadota bacterium]